MRFMVMSLGAMMITITTFAQKRPRYTIYTGDRKYFNEQFNKIIKEDFPEMQDIACRPDIACLRFRSDTFKFQITAGFSGEREIAASLEKASITLTSIFWRKLFNEFPEFNYFQVLALDPKSKREIAFTYHFLEGGLAEYFSKIYNRCYRVDLTPVKKQ
ncbi:hypothetical protein [Chitinophaga pinensis]|uniref:Uncharacterized protein n=1 Tax=Chitinophaga pinensis (strain ATCC 43595 / DSM 2588 / LMG 13176 / NBRC 15968 / NCIMB 11800 / UQM 2034) TaxID=485918 RepID=A0A979G4N9_CHIPD|nr:hypothetical protein [Chitinophaga pinensis]ACU60646.1 hypothetical protein Cpin_3179 [Chitinophaga pinensis DSM 2588]